MRSLSPVTVHAARKWLAGEAIPSQEKLRVLAKWLQVPAGWLRYGNSELNVEPYNSAETQSPADFRTLVTIRSLQPGHRVIVQELIMMLTKIECAVH